ncbi:MAG: acetylornithine deacetylase [Alphaproteobacteria bacterium]|nr:acetylornithine deacetylase [Alphaproteobacteria bacterium]
MPGPVFSSPELLSRLVAFDTTSHKSNIALVGFVEDYLTQHGVSATLVKTADGQKASLFATIGPPDTPGIALSGHTDVVPVTGQDWLSDPFTQRHEGGRYYGRGTCDMKGFLASVLALVPKAVERQLKTPLHIAFSYDEEVGCTGVRPMLAELGHQLIRPRAAIIGEPTSMRVVDAHKGPVRWQVTIKGRAAHSSMAHLGANAIRAAGELIGELARIEDDLKKTHANDRFEPGYATLQVTEIRGGNASNIVPEACSFEFDVRATPGLDPQAIEDRLKTFADQTCLPEMRRVAPETEITVTQVNSVPAFAADQSDDIIPLVLKLAEQNDTYAVSYATEAGLFQDAGVVSVVCGPGDIAQAHTANEWLAADQLEACDAFLLRLADWCATN